MRPVVQEMTPNLMNLLGTVEPRSGPEGVAYSDYRGIRGGALLNADQGFLILNVDDLMAEGGAWRALTRTLRTGPPPLPLKSPVILASRQFERRLAASHRQRFATRDGPELFRENPGDVPP